MDKGKIVSDVVVAERKFVLEALRSNVAFAALMPEEQQHIADALLVGVDPKIPHPGRTGAGRQDLPAGDRDHEQGPAGRGASGG